MSHYNLIDEEWIPVRDLAGDRKELGILDVLTNAESLASIEDPSPLVTAALHRFLLAVLYRALEGPCDIDEARVLFKEGLPKGKVRAYLEKWRERFWLFDEKYPFGQNPHIPDCEVEPWTKLTAEYNSTSSKVLFDHTDTNSSCSKPMASFTRWIITTMNFSVRGGRGYSPSPSAGGIMILPIGTTLLETLSFCLTPYPNQDIAKSDFACWEIAPHPLSFFKSKPERASTGYADRYTWLSRGIRLLEKPDGSITDVAFIAGIRHLENNNTEPMIPLRIDKVKGVRQIEIEDKGLWRDFDSLLPNGTENAPRVMDNMLKLCGRDRSRMANSFLVIGQNFSNAKIEFWRMEKFTLPSQIIENTESIWLVKLLLQTAEDTASTLNNACREMGRRLITHGERALEPDKWRAGKLSPGDITKYVNSVGIVPHFWSTLEAVFHEVLSEFVLEKNQDDIYHDWLITVRNTLSYSWTLHQRSITGSDAWAIRALVKAEDIIAKKITELNKIIQTLKEVS